MIFVVVVGYCMGRSLAHKIENLEPGRVTTDSLRHPQNDPIQVIPAGAARTLSGLNELVDQLMNNYFDQQGFPFNDTREFCLSKLRVPYPNSLVDPWTLSKLNDIGFYCIRHVIPKCATTSVAEQEAIVWPPIVWSTTSLNLLQAGTNLSSVGYSKAVQATDGKGDGGKSGSPSANTGSSSAASNGSSSGSSSSGGGSSGSKNGDGSCSVNGPCGQPCPTSCIDAALLKSLGPAPAPAATSPTQKGALTQNLDATDLAKWWSLFTEDQGGTSDGSSGGSSSSSSSKSSSSIRNIMQDHISVDSPTDSKLDTYLNTEIINAYFDKITGIPTPTFIAKFRGYTQGQIPMDEAHRNKLIDMVFYVMETVVTGLPTSLKPSFDFIWRPIPRLSQR